MTTNKRWPIFALGLAVGLAAAVLVPGIVQRKNSMTSTPTPQAPSKGRILYYRNPMHPDITSPTPTKDDMSMDYIPVYEGDDGQESPVSGHAVVKLPKWRQQLIGIKTTEAVRKPLVASIRTVGRIAYDPDLYTAMTEYKEAMLSREKVKNSTWPDVQERANALVKASAMKLKLMGLGERQIADLANEKAPTNLLVGQAGGTVWVYAEIYESDAGLVSSGQTVEVTLPALPGQTLHGTIKAVDPVLNPNTRTLRVRAEIPNQQGQLKPEMFANVSIKIPLGERLAVPSDAVFDTGERQLVFVEIAEGEFDPREVKVGRLADGFYEILSGLRPGEKIVTQANFLLDSESKLRATGLKASQGQKP
jgi:Cu(I)/Ag(I) efflux system membrane fusion protein